jgi:cephalosporin hydroxylase
LYAEISIAKARWIILMKFLQIHTFYGQYLTEFYQSHSQLQSATFEQQIYALIRDGFSGGHMFAPYLGKLGYEAHLVIANCMQAQLQWLKEKGITDIDRQNIWMEIARQQVDTIKPEILYLGDPITFDSQFVRSLNWKPTLIIGWRAAIIPQSVDWTEFDLILSSHEPSRRKALEIGAKATEPFIPGFPGFLAEVVKDEPKEWDVVFSGQVSPEHTKRLQVLQEVASVPLEGRGKFSVGYYLSASPEALPNSVQRYNRGVCWGEQMYRTLKRGKIALNVHIDLASGGAQNMRMFEATGVGSFLLTDYSSDMQQYFEPGVEIETFQDVGELLNKVDYYLEHEDEREEIARRGQERCLRDYSMSQRVIEFDRLIQKYLSHSPVSSSRSKHLSNASFMSKYRTTSILENVVSQLNFKENIQALSSINLALENQPTQLELYYGKAVALARLGRSQEAIVSLNRLLAAIPNHQKGKQLLAELNSGGSPTTPSPVPSSEAPIQAPDQAPDQASPSSSTESEIQARLQQAIQLFNTGKKIEAMRLAEKAVSLGSFVPEMHYLRAFFLNAVGRHEEALEAARQELAYNPNHAEAKAYVETLSQALVKPKPEKIPTARRPWNTSIPDEFMRSIQNATHNYSYRGVLMLKNPFDFALYPMLLWNLKPRTIIEIGSKSGGSALWFGDLFNNFEIDGYIYSIDIVKVSKVSHPRVTFMEGDGQNLQDTLSPEFLRSLPHPLLVIEDADHSYATSKATLNFFDPYLQEGDYIVVENGIISDLMQDTSYNSGPHQALKEFLASHSGEYEIDEEYCDYFGYNVTWCTNGFLKKVKSNSQQLAKAQPSQTPVNDQSESTTTPLFSSSQTQSISSLMEEAKQALIAQRYDQASELLVKAKALKQPTRGLDYLRSMYFYQLNQIVAARTALYEELRYFPDNLDASNALKQLQQQYPDTPPSQINEPEFLELLNAVRPYTMLSEARLYSLFSLVKHICLENIPGNIIECGVAGGGSTALMAAVIQRYTKQPRWLYAFDSFEGMPEPTTRDKHQGIAADATGWGTGTCAAPESSVREICEKLGVSHLVQTVKGYFQDTLPKLRDRLGMIALLHADGDWYESTKVIFQTLYDRIVNGGVIQVDDYGFWEGCRQAVHEFESQRQLKFDLHRLDDTGVWFIKPDKFPINPVFNTTLIRQFEEDDPIAQGVQSQMCTNERFQLYYALLTLLPQTELPLRFFEIGSFAGSSLLLTVRALKRMY